MENKSANFKFKALGTDITLEIVVEDKDSEKNAEENFQAVKNFYRQQEKILSRFDPGSELMKLNRKLGEFCEVSENLKLLAEKALYYWKETGGIFDPRVITILEKAGYAKDFKSIDSSGKKTKENFSSALDNDLIIEKEKLMFQRPMDFSGIAKGWITDKAATMLRKKGWENFIVDSGGDMYLAGLENGGNKWQVEVEGMENKLLLALSNEAVATSGISRRKWKVGEEKFHHLIDPRNPEHFDFKLKSVTVIAESAEKADVWAKALFILGKEKGMEISRERNIRSVFLDYQGKAFISPKMKENII